jgi:electron transport complex protein RnfD
MADDAKALEALVKKGKELTEGVLPGYMDLFIGNISGCIGETSALALLLGAAYLLYRRVITPEIPLTFIGTLALFTWIFGGSSLFTGDFVYHILSGGLFLGAFFMATDYSTTPVTFKGRLIMGIGCGLLASVIRLYTNYPEGVSFAILLMNIVVPLIDRYTVPRSFGGEKASA